MKKKVLFLCTGNSCRSQMAEGFLRHLGAGRYEAFSAGVDPTRVNPLSVKVMREADIDISGQQSKSADEFLGQKFDHVITVCDNAKQTCPTFPGEYKKTHWDLEDPAEAQGTEEEKAAVFRKTRDLIERKVREFLKDEQE
jgi:arsenate reductase